MVVCGVSAQSSRRRLAETPNVNTVLDVYLSPGRSTTDAKFFCDSKRHHVADGLGRNGIAT